MNKKLKTFINEMKKKGYKLLTKVKKDFPMMTFAKMGIENLWVSQIIQILTDNLQIHQVYPIDGHNTKNQFKWISEDIEKCQEKAESEVK